MFAWDRGQRRWIGALSTMVLWGILLGCNRGPVAVFESSPPERLIQILDRDGEAGLSESEFTEAAYEDLVFADFDLSGDGILDADEVRALLWSVPTVTQPRGFARDPREHKPLWGMWGFSGDKQAGCTKFRSFMEDAMFHLDLVGAELGNLRQQVKEVVATNECGIEQPGSSTALSALAEIWRREKLLDIFRDMGVD